MEKNKTTFEHKYKIGKIRIWGFVHLNKTTFKHKYKIGDIAWVSGKTLGLRDPKSIWKVKIHSVSYIEGATKKEVFYDFNYSDGNWINVAEVKLYATKQELLKVIEEL